jgi:hypothetical protein
MTQSLGRLGVSDIFWCPRYARGGLINRLFGANRSLDGCLTVRRYYQALPKTYQNIYRIFPSDHGLSLRRAICARATDKVCGKMRTPSSEEERWNGISEDATREILRQGEVYLDRTLQTAIAADQRATTLMGIYGAVGVALLVAGATLGTRPQPDLALITSVVVMAFLVLIAGLMCGRAGRPIDFYISGYEPEKIMASSTDRLWLLRYICDDLQSRIESNKKILQKSSVLVLVSFVAAGTSVIIGPVIFFILRITTLS